MSWSRFDDNWSNRPAFDDLDFPARWHYIRLIQRCSADGRYDGVLPYRLAMRCSDVPDPEAVLAALENVDLIEIEDKAVTVLEIDQHIPPPYIRDNVVKSAKRMRRMRRRKNDEAVTGDVTRNTGTGRDGALREPGSPTRGEQDQQLPSGHYDGDNCRYSHAKDWRQYANNRRAES